MTDGKALPLGELMEEYYDHLHEAYDAMRTAFKQRGITQDEIAKRLGVDKALISKRLNGQENLTLKTLSFMATAMECKLCVEYVPYEMIGAVEPNESTQDSAWWLPPLQRNGNTADEQAYVEPLRKAA